MSSLYLSPQIVSLLSGGQPSCPAGPSCPGPHRCTLTGGGSSHPSPSRRTGGRAAPPLDSTEWQLSAWGRVSAPWAPPQVERLWVESRGETAHPTACASSTPKHKDSNTTGHLLCASVHSLVTWTIYGGDEQRTGSVSIRPGMKQTNTFQNFAIASGNIPNYSSLWLGEFCVFLNNAVNDSLLPFSSCHHNDRPVHSTASPAVQPPASLPASAPLRPGPSPCTQTRTHLLLLHCLLAEKRRCAVKASTEGSKCTP